MPRFSIADWGWVVPVAVLTSTLIAPGLAAQADPAAIGEHDNSRIAVVRTFADNVLEKGRDRWSGEETPLLVDGLNARTLEPVHPHHPRSEAHVIHNLARQQILFRTLVGLTNLTGKEEYRRAAEETIQYHFDHLRFGGGLLRWGGHQFIDLKTLEPVRRNDDTHELQSSAPFYELMWEVNPEATREFIHAHWNAHIQDWRTLDFNRHGDWDSSTDRPWDREFEQPEPLFNGALTFIMTGSELIRSACMLYLFTEDEDALTWGQRLAEQYVRARHPETGLGAFQYTIPERRQDVPEGPLTGRQTWTTYGDRAENQFGDDFPEVANEAWRIWGWGGRGIDQNIYFHDPMIQLELAEKLGDQGQQLLEWTVDGLKAAATFAYDAEQNQFRPIWADGTDLTGYRFPRTAYFGREGTEFQPRRASGQFLLSYARAYRLSRDASLWKTVHSIAKGLGLGDLGTRPGQAPDLNLATGSSDAYALLALLELDSMFEAPVYLELAEAIGENVIATHFHHGFFVPSENHFNAQFDAIEPLALLSLEAAKRGIPEAVPTYSGGNPGAAHGNVWGRAIEHEPTW